jgi:hypothetical protein
MMDQMSAVTLRDIPSQSRTLVMIDVITLKAIIADLFNELPRRKQRSITQSN